MSKKEIRVALIGHQLMGTAHYFNATRFITGLTFEEVTGNQ
jgi:hypothetical protein